jgi:NADH-quinone oxidoreductase subunit C
MLDINEFIKKINNDNSDFGLKLTDDNTSIVVNKEHLILLMQVLKGNYKFIMLADMTSVDYIDYFEIIYHVMDFDANLLRVKVRLERDDIVIPSLTSVWKAADVQEREIFDLMGIVFSGHSNLKRILCKDDFYGYPLRKDFKLDIVNRF